jgi:hypothetical protein
VYANAIIPAVVLADLPQPDESARIRAGERESYRPHCAVDVLIIPTAIPQRQLCRAADVVMIHDFRWRAPFPPSLGGILSRVGILGPPAQHDCRAKLF